MAGTGEPGTGVECGHWGQGANNNVVTTDELHLDTEINRAFNETLRSFQVPGDGPYYGSLGQHPNFTSTLSTYHV